VGTDGTGLTQLTFDAPPGGTFSPVWYEDAVVSGNGETVAFTQQVPSPTNPNPIKVEHLYLIDADGSNRREIVLPLDAFGGIVEWFQPLSFSADGTELAFVYSDFISSRESVVRVGAIRTDRTGFRKLVDPLQGPLPALSGDWTTMAFSGPGGLSIMNTDGTGLRVLDTTPTANPSISFDGSEICYAALVGFQHTDVFCISADATNRRNITNTPTGGDAFGNPLSAYYPAISGNGAVVAFFSTADLDAGKNSDFSPEVFAARLKPVDPPNPSPTIDSITPQTGPVTGSTSVTITGTGFVDGVNVTFGGAPAVVLDVQPTAIIALTPAHAAGPVAVTVINPNGGFSFLPDSFSYVDVSLYCIVTTASPPDGGSIQTTPNTQCFPDGTVVTLSAVPAAGFRFAGWRGDVSGSTNPLLLAIQSNLQVVALFEALPLYGSLGIVDSSRWPLNGPGVRLVSVRAISAGTSHDADVNGSSFSFPNLPPGTYRVAVEVSYLESVAIDNTLFDCNVVPGQGTRFEGPLLKRVTTDLPNVSVPAAAAVNVNLPPMLVMVHGIESSARKWYDESNSLYWDPFARTIGLTSGFGRRFQQRGFVSLTPNYLFRIENADWASAADEVETHVIQNASRLTLGSGVPPWVVIAHSQGGLVARVLANRSSAAVSSLKGIYMLGTPNSGMAPSLEWVTDLTFCYPYLQDDELQPSFNAQYSTFGRFDGEVRAYAGRTRLTASDYIVPVDNVRQIRVANDATTFTIPTDLVYLSAFGQKDWFTLPHNQLGSPATLGVLRTILARVAQPN
jgi:pimeloyl-ACP methyl ester carboxylesterase/Tol biopolymer transport system component